MTVDDPKHWRERAVTMRALAEEMEDADCKRSMLNIADEYERIAKRAEAWSDGRPPHSK